MYAGKCLIEEKGEEETYYQEQTLRLGGQAFSGRMLVLLLVYFVAVVLLWTQDFRTRTADVQKLFAVRVYLFFEGCCWLVDVKLVDVRG